MTFLTVVVNCRRGVKFVGRNFSYWRSFQCFTSSSTAISLANKRRLPFDSACSKGVETTFQGVLTVASDGV